MTRGNPYYNSGRRKTTLSRSSAERNGMRHELLAVNPLLYYSQSRLTITKSVVFDYGYFNVYLQIEVF